MRVFLYQLLGLELVSGKPIVERWYQNSNVPRQGNLVRQ